MGEYDVVVGERGIGLLDAGDVLRCGGTGSSVPWVGDVGYVPAHWEDLGQLPPQGGPQIDKAENAEGSGWELGVHPTVGGYGVGGTVGGGYLRQLPPEHSCTVHCSQYQYIPMSSGRATPRNKGI